MVSCVLYYVGVMRALFEGKVNMVLALGAVVLAIVAGAAVGVYYTRDTVYDYRLAVRGGDGKEVALQYGVWPELANADFFHTVRDGFIAERANFVEANLTAMTLSVYRDGTQVLSVPIKSKGKEGSWWETPSGLYRAQGKEKEHFSSFGHVYMPWSIPFQGNFFIHGWPYHEDGTPVPEGYSGGCMRLEDIYAKQVYDLVEVGMPVLVFEEHPEKLSFSYALKAPSISAPSYLVADLENNFVLLAGGQTAPRETSLLAKLVTAVVSSEYQNIEKTITVRDDMLEGLTPNRLTVGSSYSLYDLFFPLLQENSTEAARTLAGYFGEKRFVGLMQAKVAALGMRHTDFTDAAGVRTGNLSTAEDIFLFLKYLHTNRPFILSMSAGTASTRTYGVPLFGDTAPLHPLKDEQGFEGGMSEAERVSEQGGTAAAVILAFASSTESTQERDRTYDLYTVFDITFNGDERPIAFVVLSSADPAADTRELVSYAKRLYE